MKAGWPRIGVFKVRKLSDRFTHRISVHANFATIYHGALHVTLGILPLLLVANPALFGPWTLFVTLELFVAGCICLWPCNCGVVLVLNKEDKERIRKRRERIWAYKKRKLSRKTIIVLYFLALSPVFLAFALPFCHVPLLRNAAILLAGISINLCAGLISAFLCTLGVYNILIGITGKAETMCAAYKFLSAPDFCEASLEGKSLSELEDLTKSALITGDLDQADMISKKLLLRTESSVSRGEGTQNLPERS